MFNTLFEILWLPFSSIQAVYLLWILYLAVMNLKRARDAGKLSKVAATLGYPILFAGYLLDFMVNVVVLSVVLLEVPKETTVTARLRRHANGPDTYRKKLSLWVAHHFLDVFDPSGKHI